MFTRTVVVGRGTARLRRAVACGVVVAGTWALITAAWPAVAGDIAPSCAALTFCVSPALAGSDLEVREAWVRATVPGQPVAGAYLTLKSASPLRLISARSEVARAVELHQMSLNDGVMRMRRLESLELPAGQEVKLAPGGIHLMLLDLKRPLSAGEEIELDLVTRARIRNRERRTFACRCGRSRRNDARQR